MNNSLPQGAPIAESDEEIAKAADELCSLGAAGAVITGGGTGMPVLPDNVRRLRNALAGS
jgi:hypothetical protein